MSTSVTVAVPTSWKTTLCGAITALGAYLTSTTDPTWLPILGKALVIAGPLLLGFFSKDSNVTGGTVPQPTVANPPSVTP